MANIGNAQQRPWRPATCELCPPSYGWCQKHERCLKHCDCPKPTDMRTQFGPFATRSTE